MNRYQIRRRVQGLLRDDSYPVEALNEALNRVLLDLNGLGRFRFQQNLDTVTLVSGTFKYNITSSIMSEKLVVYQLGATDQVILDKVAEVEPAIENGLFLASGVPAHYMRWNEQWWLDPIPDVSANGKTVTIFHYKDIAEVTNDLASPAIPSRWHGTLLVYGVASDIAPGLMVRGATGMIMVGQAYQQARKEFLTVEGWDPYTDKKLIRDERWAGFQFVGHVGKVR